MKKKCDMVSSAARAALMEGYPVSGTKQKMKDGLTKLLMVRTSLEVAPRLRRTNYRRNITWTRATVMHFLTVPRPTSQANTELRKRIKYLPRDALNLKS